MMVFAVEVVNGSGDRKMSQEGYLRYDDAERFIRNRSDHPQKVSRHTFKSDFATYNIHEIRCE